MAAQPGVTFIGAEVSPCEQVLATLPLAREEGCVQGRESKANAPIPASPKNARR